MLSALLGVALLAGCFSPARGTCAVGRVCPLSELGRPAGSGCVDPGLVEGCAGLGEDANCTAVAGGVCLQGVCTATQWQASVALGSSASVVTVADPFGVAVDQLGDLFVADTSHHRILEMDTGGVITTIAGTGVGGFSGDGGQATAATLASPAAVAVDGLGNLYIADAGNARVRQVDPAGIITTIAGTGGANATGDGGPATEAEIGELGAVAVDGLGDVYVADFQNSLIREIDANGMIATVAGSGGELAAPNGVAIDGDAIVIADSGHNQIDRVEASGRLTVIAGTGSNGYAGDGSAATAALLADPFGVAVDAAGAIYVADRSNDRIRRIAGGLITTVAGTGVLGFSGDGGSATAAQIFDPYSVAVDAAGTIYIAEFDNRVRAVSPAAVITTVVGNGNFAATGDGGAATCANLDNPNGVGVGSGALYIADTTNQRIRRVDASGVITTIAGTGMNGFAGDGGAAIDAELSSPIGVAVDAAGNVYIADGNHVRRVDGGGTITTVAGGGSGARGDGGPATAATLEASAVAVDAAGNLYIADPSDARVRRVDAAGIITTFAGGGSAGSGVGDGGPATAARLSDPDGLAIDSDGSVYIVDVEACRIRRVDAAGIITTIAGTGVCGSGGGSSATAAELDFPSGVAVDLEHDVFTADQDSQVVRRIDPSGAITTVAGTSGVPGGDGDGGAAIAAHLNDPVGVAVDAAGNLYIDDLGNQRIRRVDPTGVITSVAGTIDQGEMGPLAQARLAADPRAMVATPAATLFAGGASGTIQALTATSLTTIAGRYPQGVVTGALARFRDTSFGDVSGVAYDAADGVILLTESTTDQVLAVTVDADPDRSTIASLANESASAGFADGMAASALFRAPTGLYFDGSALYVADTGNDAIRVIDLSQGLAGATVSTLAGTPQVFGFAGDGSAATSALLFAPQAITKCSNGDLFIADTGNNRVRRIAAGTGTISTVLGDGSVSSSGEGSPSSSFPVDAPLSLGCDAVGNLFVTSTSTVRMLLANPNGAVDGGGAVQTIYGQPPHTTYPASVTRCLAGLVVLDTSTVQITDSCTGLLVELQRQVVTP